MKLNKNLTTYCSEQLIKGWRNQKINDVAVVKISTNGTVMVIINYSSIDMSERDSEDDNEPVVVTINLVYINHESYVVVLPSFLFLVENTHFISFSILFKVQ